MGISIEEDALSPVDGQLLAFNARDIDRFTMHFTEDVRVEDAEGRLLCEGHDGMRAFYGKRFVERPGTRREVLTRITIGNHVVDEELLTDPQWGQTRSLSIHTVRVNQISKSIILR